MCTSKALSGVGGGGSGVGEAAVLAAGGSIGLNAFSAYEGAKAKRGQAYYEASIADTNAMLADSAAVDAVYRGGLAVNEARLAGRKLKGAQVAAAAAGGVDVGEGAARQIQDETEFLTEQDVATLRTNAARQAWGYRTEAKNYRTSAQMLRAVGKSSSPGRAAGMSIMSDASQIATKMFLG